MRLFNTQRIARVVLMSMCCSIFFTGAQVFAAMSGDVVINEVAWSGSVDSSSDEYIELYNPGTHSIDLSNWVIEDDDGVSVYTIASGVIAPNGYFLIESNEDAVKSVSADAVMTLSLANTGDKLVLKDGSGNSIDTVNSAGGAWFAGNSTGKMSMERIDALASGDQASNWATNIADNGASASVGSLINGTPKGFNSVSVMPPTAPMARMVVSNDKPLTGDTVFVAVEVKNIADLFAYGFDVTYDSQVLKYVTVHKKAFLNESGTVNTSFQAGLENATVGKIVVAEARTVDPKTTVSVDGELFTVEFEVIGAAEDTTTIAIAGSSFLAGVSADIPASFMGIGLTVQAGSVGGSTDPVTGITAKEAVNRYEIEIGWQAPGSGADSYKVSRRNAAGAFVEIGTMSGNSFVDKDGVSLGGSIIPGVEYVYKVVAVKGGVESDGVEVVGKETRGLRGDSNRSDRVDGRDLESLARHFGETLTDGGFDSLVDTTYDGSVDGGDLLDLTSNWARTFSVS